MTFDPKQCGEAVAKLTPREKEILLAITNDIPRKQIAASLEITPGTVNRHCEHIFEKFGVRTIVGAVRTAFVGGLVASACAWPAATGQ